MASEKISFEKICSLFEYKNDFNDLEPYGYFYYGCGDITIDNIILMEQTSGTWMIYQTKNILGMNELKKHNESLDPKNKYVYCQKNGHLQLIQTIGDTVSNNCNTVINIDNNTMTIPYYSDEPISIPISSFYLIKKSGGIRKTHFSSLYDYVTYWIGNKSVVMTNESNGLLRAFVNSMDSIDPINSYTSIFSLLIDYDPNYFSDRLDRFNSLLIKYFSFDVLSLSLPMILKRAIDDLTRELANVRSLINNRKSLAYFLEHKHPYIELLNVTAEKSIDTLPPCFIVEAIKRRHELFVPLFFPWQKKSRGHFPFIVFSTSLFLLNHMIN